MHVTVVKSASASLFGFFAVAVTVIVFPALCETGFAVTVMVGIALFTVTETLCVSLCVVSS